MPRITSFGPAGRVPAGLHHLTIALSTAIALAAGSLASLPSPATAQETDTDRPVELAGFVVTATPVPVPVGTLGSHVSILDGAELRTAGVADVATALRSVSGISVARVGSFGARSSIFMRGGESDYVMVLLDGVPINDPGGAIDLSGLTTENVERIEVVRGPLSGLYGSDAVAGVVHIVTRSGSEGMRGSATLRGGSFATVDGVLAVRGGNDAGSFSATLARYDTDGILDLNNAHRNTVFSGRADLALGDASTVRVTARLADRVYRFPTDDTGAPIDINQSSFWEESTVGVELTRSVSDAFGIRTLLTIHDVSTGTDDPLDSPEDDASFFSLDSQRRVTADVRADYRATDEATLSAAVEVERAGLRSWSESTSSFGSFSGRSDDNRTNRAGYLHAVVTWERWSANAGIRLEDNEQFGGFTTFQLGSAFTPRAGTGLRFAAGRGIKEPSFFENFASGFTVGNPDLEPEQSLSWEIGIDQDLGARARVGVTWFSQTFDDLIQYTGSPPGLGDPNYYNVAKADSRGLEAEATVELGPATVTGSWTWLDTEVVDSGFDSGVGATFVEGEPLIRRPANQVTLSGRGNAASRIGWNAELRWVDERADRFFPPFPAPPEPINLPSYTVVSVGLDIAVAEPSGSRPGLDLLLRGENLGDAAYEEAFGFEAPGRAIYVGGRLRWGGP